MLFEATFKFVEHLQFSFFFLEFFVTAWEGAGGSSAQPPGSPGTLKNNKCVPPFPGDFIKILFFFGNPNPPPDFFFFGK